MFATIRFPARIGRINYHTSSRMINATETEGASGQSIVRIVARDRELAAWWTSDGQAKGFFLLTAAFCTRVHRRRILIVWQIRFLVSPINHLRLLFFSSCHNFIRLRLSQLPRSIISTAWFSLFLPFSRIHRRPRASYNLTFDQRRLLIRCQELYLKIRRSGIYLRPRAEAFHGSANDRRDNSSNLDAERYHVAETRAKEKPWSGSSLSPTIFSSSTLIFTTPLRFNTREYIICIYNNTYYNNNLVVIFKLQ